MLSDRQLRDYVEGALLPAQRAELERFLADIPNSLREVVAQQRIDQALRVAFGDEAGAGRIKQSILDIMIETPQPEVEKRAPASVASRHAARPKARPARRRNPWVLAGLVAAIALAIFAIVHQLGNIARLDVTASGTELIRHGKAKPARAGALLRKDDALRVGESAIVEYSDATLLTLGPGTSVTFSKPARDTDGKRVEVSAGNLKVVVRPQPSGQPMVVASEQAVVTSTNATFALVVDPAQTRVEVSAGALHLERASDKSAVDVHAGEFAETGTDGELVASPLHPEAPKSE